MPQTMKLALLDDYQKVALRLADWDRLRKRCIEITVFNEPFASVDDAAQKLAPFEILGLLRERTAFPRALIEKLPNLKFMVLTGARAASLDDKAATERGIPISTTPGGGSNAPTAELGWALLMSCARDLAKAERLMRSGGWHDGIQQMNVLEGKRLGILGLGKLGSRVAGYAKAFGMDVVAWSQNLTAEKAGAIGVKYVSKDELLSTSDFISIHLALSDRTRGLIGAAELAKMKKTAILVNTSRGPIVDEAALIAALKNGTIAHAGLDVYDKEPLPAGHPLTKLENVTLVPHLGYVVEESYRFFYDGTIKDIEAWLDGKPINVLNPDALKK
ncbi:D-2-hydroxyacid dehydrogenase family protein [Reyranella sp.]|uniref:D-2-hydroxyacid dehydrogenase family protein n=1 Tax=Reyranella sp. TaxID=1929291 RepID=UPI00121EE895|nr:D-2-hydroxyacid dehydrogenase family protein [Reyranella sp.]TAJ81771.1 MAG: D-2-hydroxyacid dehydrogenase family protein [Reyranella sp.]